MSDYSGGGKIKPASRRNQSRKPYNRPRNKKSLFSRVTDSFKTLLTPITPGWLINKSGENDIYVEGTPTPSSSADCSPQINHVMPSKDTSDNCQPSTSHSRLNHNYSTPPSSILKQAPEKIDLKADFKLKAQGGKKDLLAHLSKTNVLTTQDQEMAAPNISSSSVTSTSGAVQSQTQASDDVDSIRQLWSMSPSVRRQQTTMTSSKRPRFNSSLFGAPGISVTSTEENNLIESSFYPGSTRYGGANSLNRRNYLNSQSPYRFPKVTKVRVRQLDQSTSSAGGGSNSSQSERTQPQMSSTARKIFEVIDRMSTPLNDVKKIPSHTMPRTPSSFMAERQKRRRSINTSIAPSQAPPTGGREMVTSPVKIRRMNPSLPLNSSSALMRKSIAQRNVEKHDEKSPILTTSEVTVSKVTALTTTTPIQGVSATTASLSSSESLKHRSSGGKMKQQRHSSHYSSFHGDEDDDDNKTELPAQNSIPLPVSNKLPNFSFGIPAAQSTPAPPDLRSKDKSKKNPTLFSYNFAKPMDIKQPEVKSNLAAEGSQPVYKFSSPNASILEEGKPTASPPISKLLSDTPKSKSSTFAQNNGHQKLLAGSCMDILKGKSPSTSESGSKPFKITSGLKSDGEWECDTCMLYNKADSIKCVACQSYKPGTKDSQKLQTDSLLSQNKSNSKPLFPFGIQGTQSETKNPVQFGTQNKSNASDSQWECDTCMIFNKPDVVKCIACESPKPGTKPTNSLSPMNTFSKLKSDSGIKVQFGIPSSKSDNDKKETKALRVISNKPGSDWECDTCMVFNKPDADKCIACETPKSGPKVQTLSSQNTFSKIKTSSSPTINFKFGTSSTSSNIKKTNKQSDSSKNNNEKWECSVCMVFNKPDVGKCIACETPKSGVEEKPTLSSNNTFSKLKSTSNSSVKFGFGVPAEASTLQTKDNPAQNWGDKFKSSPGSWECEVCLVKNKRESERCAACESPKPGLDNTNSNSSFKSSFKFGNTSSGLFSFGVPSSAQVEKAQKEENLKPRPEKDETNLQATAKLEVQISSPKIEETKSAALTFNFGTKDSAEKPGLQQKSVLSALAPATTTEKLSTSAPTFQFGAKTTTVQAKSAEVKATAASFNFGASAGNTVTSTAPVSSAPPSAMFNFGKTTPSPTQTTQATISNNSATTAPAFQASASMFAPVVTQTSSTSLQQTTLSNTSTPSAISSAFPLQTNKPISVLPKLADDPSSAQKSFAFGTPSKPAETGTFKFGGGEKPKPSIAFGGGNKDTPSSTATAAPFQFGQSAKTTTSSLSQSVFGGQQSTTNTTSTGSSGFLFGQKQEPPPAFGSLAKPAPKPAKPAFGGFNTAPATTTATPAFAFSSNSQNQSSVFGGATTTSASLAKPFGSASTSAQFSSGGTSVFGSGTSNALPKPSFNFGASPTQPKTNTGSGGFGGGGGFNFSAAASSTTSASNSTTSTGFNFGTSATKPKPFGASNDTGFNFGSSNNNAPSNNQSSDMFKFGGNTEQKSEQNKPFVFGASKPASNPSSVFGSPQSNTGAFGSSQQSNGGVFGNAQTGNNAFNSSQTGNSAFNSKPSGGFNFAGASSPSSTGFNFGGSSTATPNASPFSAQPAQNAFSIGSSDSATNRNSNPFGSGRRATTPTGQRQIKRAQRKLRK